MSRLGRSAPFSTPMDLEFYLEFFFFTIRIEIWDFLLETWSPFQNGNSTGTHISHLVFFFF